MWLQPYAAGPPRRAGGGPQLSPEYTRGMKEVGAASHLRLVALALLAWALAGAAPSDRYQSDRHALIREIENDVRDTAQYLNRRELDARVLRALDDVPRHEFVLPQDRALAYENRPLPIGHGQTISQPYIVAVMTDLVEPAVGCRALEVGTGSGYQAAVLSRLCETVHTLEIIEPLGNSARQRVARLGYRNVSVRVADGYYGWKKRRRTTSSSSRPSHRTSRLRCCDSSSRAAGWCCRSARGSRRRNWCREQGRRRPHHNAPGPAGALCSADGRTWMSACRSDRSPSFPGPRSQTKSC